MDKSQEKVTRQEGKFRLSKNKNNQIKMGKKGSFVAIIEACVQ